MRRILAISLVVLVGAGGATALVIARDSGSESRDEPAEARPGAGVTLVAGRAEILTLSLTLLDPLPTPVTIEALDRGAASAQLSPVMIDGREQSVAWGGGTPLVLEGAGADADAGGLILDPTSVEATTAGVVVDLSGATGRLSPGHYVIPAPVAIGAEGLAQPADRTAFEATVDTRVSFKGPAVVRLPTEPLTLEGPGEGRLIGDVEVTTAGADRRLSGLEFGPAPYRFDLVWLEDRIELDGEIEAEIRAVPGPSPTPTSP